MAEESFGAHIDRPTAERYFKKFMEIKSRSLPKIKQALQGDDDALRYYCGRPEATNPVAEDWAFVFDKESIDRLRNSVISHGADGIFVFYAAKDVSGLPLQLPPNPNDVDGRPTLMIFPYKQHEPATANGTEFEILLDDGEQHPGSGGGKADGYEIPSLPDGFTEGQYFR